MNNMKIKIKKWLFKLNLKLNNVYKKLVFVTLVCSLLPLLLVSIISYGMSYRIAKSRTIDSLKATNTQIALNIDNRLSQVESLSNSVSFYLYKLYNAPLAPLSSYLDAYSYSKNSLGTIKNTFDLFQISIFLPEDRFMDSHGNGIDFFPLEVLPDYNMTSEELFEAGSRSFWRVSRDLNFPAAFSPKPKNVISCWSAYRSISSNSLRFAFACHVKLSEFTDLLASNRINETSSFVIDKNNLIIMDADESKVASVFEMGGEELWTAENHAVVIDGMLFVTEPIAGRDLLLVTQIPMSYIWQSSNVVLTFLLLSIISIIGCTVLLTVIASKAFTRRLHVLSSVMRSVKASDNRESLSLLEPMTGKPQNGQDEIDHLAATYRQMILENDEYFDRILEMSLHTEKLKFQLLQSQINPHFLFNTLNTIISCQSLGKTELAKQTISNLSSFYRHILHDPDILITIREELSITELYLKLICVCKPNPITWEFEADEGTENFLICKFIFQPFVENAIIHGIADSSQSLHIRIGIYYEEDSLLIKISDNGAGISPEKLGELTETLENHIADYGRHFGIGNVNVRLTPYFSRDFSHILLESTPGMGTVFTICLKQMIEDEDA